MVIISNGHSKFILGTAAAEAYARGVLDAYITAGYPKKNVQAALFRLKLDRLQSVRSLIARQEAIPDHLVYPQWISELLKQLATGLRRFKSVSECTEIIAMRLYGDAAAEIVKRIDSKIYHYRSGYGLASVAASKQNGMIAVCDHSIAHPAVLQYLIDNQGRLPMQGKSGPISRFWKNVLDDIDQADHVIVNSDFVKETFLNQNYPAERIHVVYTGLDQQFLDAVPERSLFMDSTKPMQLLFAGEFGPRKGAGVLVEALSRLQDLPWKLEIIGTIDPAIRQKYAAFLENERVVLTGHVPRLQLAERMSVAEIFIFPSLAEGSARVVFMAMACGCYVITTPNSGSVVVDGINGALIPPGDSDALESAIRKANQARNTLKSIGSYNADIIKTKYQQACYGAALYDTYGRILEKHPLQANQP